MFLKVQDIMKILSVKRAKAYQVMAQLNEELKEDGYLVIAGRVPKDYFMMRKEVKNHGKDETIQS